MKLFTTLFTLTSLASLAAASPEHNNAKRLSPALINDNKHAKRFPYYPIGTGTGTSAPYPTASGTGAPVPAPYPYGPKN